MSSLLQTYDAQLRAEGELPGATHIERLGPLLWGTFAAGRVLITYASLDGVDLAALVATAGERFAADPDLTRLEWKTRGHDHAPGLHELLVAAGFVPGETESVMIGSAETLAVDLPLPDGVSIRRISEPDDVRAMAAMSERAFGEASPGSAEELLTRLANRRDDLELWVAEHEGTMISAGRLEPVAGADFAGIWGGCTLPQWRGRGIYRALTAERARSALARGKTLVHSDSTEYSRPILERYGFTKITTTTPYELSRP
ncbi:MAG: GNAT family N-acetyltransferase [Propionibacteriales bacterium]|nr:GNAT family N-acetyltransferase [Propionibacteriales bacterium]